MTATYACLSLLGYIFFIQRRSGLPFGYLPFCTMALLAVGGFIAAMADVYPLYKTVTLRAGLLLLAVSAMECLWRRWRAAQAQDRHTPGSLEQRQENQLAALFSAVLLALPWYYQGATLRYYDEFYWGNLLKALLEEGQLLSASSPISEAGIPLLNPPGPALLQSFFMPGAFVESGMAVAGLALVLAFGCVVVHIARPALGLGSALLLALLCCGVVRCVGTLYEGTYLIGYTDYLQSAAFASLLCIAVFEPDKRRRFLLLVPGLALLALFKATGFLFAAGAIAAALVAQGKNTLRWRSLLGTLLLLLLPLLGIKLLWDWHVHSVLVTHDPVTKFAAAIPNILETMGNGVSQRALFYLQSLKAVALAIYDRPLIYSPWIPYEILNVFTSTLSLLGQMALALMALARFGKVRLPLGQMRVLCLLLLGLAGWIGLRWIISVHGHAPDEALRAASYERYIGAYMSGFISLFLIIFYGLLANNGDRLRRIALPLLAGQCLIFLAICGALLPWPLPGQLPPSPVRQEMEKAKSFLEAHSEAGSRVWFIAQNTDPQPLLALRFLAAPERVVGIPAYIWSLGAPYHSHDRFSAPLPPKELRQRAKQSSLDYILLWKYDARFVHDYGAELGVTTPGKEPILLDTRKWREGSAPLPERVGSAPPAL